MELRNTLSDWLGEAARTCVTLHHDVSVIDRYPQATPGDVVAAYGQAFIDVAVAKAVAHERERIARDLELVEEFCKDYTFETGEVLIPRDVAAEIARSGIGPTSMQTR